MSVINKSNVSVGSLKQIDITMKRFSITASLYLGLIKIAAAQETMPACTEIGAFEIDDGTCKNYYICVDDGEKLNAVILKCAISAIFDPMAGRCVLDEGNMCQQTTTSPPTTQAPCTRYGRFPLNDEKCKNYYLCYWDGIEYSRMDNLQCPKTLVFNPTSEKCVLPQSYTCPTMPE